MSLFISKTILLSGLLKYKNLPSYWNRLLATKAHRTGDQAPADWQPRLSTLGVKAQQKVERPLTTKLLIHSFTKTYTIANPKDFHPFLAATARIIPSITPNKAAKRTLISPDNKRRHKGTLRHSCQSGSTSISVFLSGSNGFCFYFFFLPYEDIQCWTSWIET